MTSHKSEQYFQYEGEKRETAPVEKIKEGVSFIFEKNPALASIGTKEQYSEYLDSIFPQSAVKRILWHAAFEKFQTFDKSLIGKNTDQGLIDYYGKGFYFSQDDDIDRRWNRPFKIPVVVNYSSEKETRDNYEGSSHVVIENPSDIHVLGSERDLEGFKQFVKRPA